MINSPEEINIISAKINTNGYFININNQPTIIINQNLKGVEENLTLAEEIAHYKVGVYPTLPFETSYYNKLIRSKNEFKAFKWMQSNLLPQNIENLKYTNIWELADKFEVTPEFISKAINYRKENSIGS